MNNEEKIMKCQEMFDNISMTLCETYEEMGSCNKDISAYLVPIGTTDEVTYHSKPELSFRISDHWNWYSNTKKCPDAKYIQCYCDELPYAKRRLAYGKASTPIFAICVCLFKNNKYHVVYGEYYDRKTKTWHWRENNIENILAELY